MEGYLIYDIKEIVTNHCNYRKCEHERSRESPSKNRNINQIARESNSS